MHSHRQTYETFTVAQGRFEVSWNDDGSGSIILELFDTVSFPPSDKSERQIDLTRFAHLSGRRGGESIRELAVVVRGGMLPYCSCDSQR